MIWHISHKAKINQQLYLHTTGWISFYYRRMASHYGYCLQVCPLGMSGAEASSGSVDSAVAVPLQLGRTARDVHNHKKRSRSIDEELEPADIKTQRQRLQDEDRSASSGSRAASVADTVTENHPPLEYIQDPLTGRRIYKKDAKDAIALILGSLSAEDPFKETLFKVKQKGGFYICKVNIPKSIPISSFKGTPASSAEEAESQGCFRLCHELRNLGILDFRLFSQLRGNQDSRAARPEDIAHAFAKSSGTTQRYTRKRPAFLTDTAALSVDRLFPLVVHVKIPEGRAHAPLLILARTPFPQMSSFRVFVAETKAVVHLYRGAAFEVDDKKLSLLHRYTLRLARSLTNKALECEAQSLAFLFAPLDSSWNEDYDARAHWTQLPAVASHIPWARVEEAANSWVTGLAEGGTQLTNSRVEDYIVQDRSVEFTNRHYVVRVRHDLTPMSKAEDSAVRPPLLSSFPLLAPANVLSSVRRSTRVL